MMVWAMYLQDALTWAGVIALCVVCWKHGHADGMNEGYLKCWHDMRNKPNE